MAEDLSPKAAELLTHTRELLTSGGYNSFSYADLAARVGISKASIHHHFPTKELLVTTVVALYRQDARDGLAYLVKKFNEPVRQLEAYAGYWEDCIRSGDSPFCICAMLATELPTIPEGVAAEVRTHFRDLTTWLASVLERGAALGQFRLNGSPTESARGFMAVVHGAMLVARATDDPKVFGSIVRPAITALVQ